MTGKTLIEMIYRTPFRLFPFSKDLHKPDLDVLTMSDYIQRIQESIVFVKDRHAKTKTK